MNKNEYKASMSGIHPSDNVVERIMDMTYKEKNRHSQIFKKVACAAFALAIFCAGGFCINSAIVKNKDNFSIIVANAEDVISIKEATKQGLIYNMYIAPADDKELDNKLHEKARADCEKIRSEGLKLIDSGELVTINGVGQYEIYDDTGDIAAIIYTASGGTLAVNTQDYEEVKSFTVENESEYGLLQFETEKAFLISEEISTLSDKELLNYRNGDYVFDEEDPYGFFIGHKFTLTGDELRSTQKFLSRYGYTLEWHFSQELEKAVAENPHFDITQIKDKITFTFEYNDGSVKKASADISFDKEGHMEIR